jgi:hypothetical protein
MKLLEQTDPQLPPYCIAYFAHDTRLLNAIATVM